MLACHLQDGSQLGAGGGAALSVSESVSDGTAADCTACGLHCCNQRMSPSQLTVLSRVAEVLRLFVGRFSLYRKQGLAGNKCLRLDILGASLYSVKSQCAHVQSPSQQTVRQGIPAHCAL